MFRNSAWNTCKHLILLKATNIVAFIKAGEDGFYYLYTPREPPEAFPIPYDEITFCANPACERVESKTLGTGRYL